MNNKQKKNNNNNNNKRKTGIKLIAKNFNCHFYELSIKERAKKTKKKSKTTTPLKNLCILKFVFSNDEIDKTKVNVCRYCFFVFFLLLS